MAQGWNINSTTDIITFLENTPAGVNNIVVKQFAAGGYGGTDVWAVGAWSGRYGYPSEIEFYADRLWLAGTPLDPQTIWASCIGDYNNHGRSSPIIDSDAVSFVINARQVNVVKDLVPLDNLLVLTTGGEFKVTGGQDDVVTPSTIGVKNQGNSGTGDVQARVIGESAIFHQAEGNKIRDLAYKFEKDGFRGNEISVWANHLFEGYSTQWIEYWKAPWQVIWVTRTDGVRLGCTYMPEQEVIGWHWHDTDGKFLDACALPGAMESDCYYLVQRTVNGEVVQCIEQQAPTRYSDADDLFYVDCGATYDGRNTGSDTITLSTGAGWTEDDELTITASAPIFQGITDQDDGFEIKRTMVELNDEFEEVERLVKVRVIIDEYVSPTVVKAHSIGAVPVELQNYAATRWKFMRTTIGDLWHIEGKYAYVLADAGVQGPIQVVNGQIELGDRGGVVHVGLRYKCEVETLELNAPGGDPMRDQNKLGYKATILLLASRGVKAGGATGPLYPIKYRQFEAMGEPPVLHTGVVEQAIPSEWGENAGKIRVYSYDPLPMEILSLTTKAVGSNKP